jgi:hypothetical protein
MLFKLTIAVEADTKTEAKKALHKALPNLGGILRLYTFTIFGKRTRKEKWKM